MIEEFLSSKWYADYRALVQKTNIPELEKQIVGTSVSWLKDMLRNHELDAADSTARIRRLKGQRDTAKNRDRIHFAIEQKIRHEMLAERIREELDRRKEEPKDAEKQRMASAPRQSAAVVITAPRVPPPPSISEGLARKLGK